MISRKVSTTPASESYVQECSSIEEAACPPGADRGTKLGGEMLEFRALPAGLQGVCCARQERGSSAGIPLLIDCAGQAAIDVYIESGLGTPETTFKAWQGPAA